MTVRRTQAQRRERTIRKLASTSPDDLPDVVAEHTHRLINKILHLPLKKLDPKDESDDGMPLEYYANALAQLFQLTEADKADTDDPPPNPEPNAPPNPEPDASDSSVDSQTAASPVESPADSPAKPGSKADAPTSTSDAEDSHSANTTP